MARIFYFFLITINISSISYSQIQVNESKINPSIISDFWPASWITCPDASITGYGVFHFRKSFKIEKVPEEFIVHVSADNRYILYVNGVLVTYGPARGDLQHWRFESLDINKYLTPGENVIAAVVWNFGEHIPAAQITRKTAFIMCGNGEKESIVNTDGFWKVYNYEAYKPITGSMGLIRTFTLVGPGDYLDGNKYPWNWEQLDYDDSDWENPRVLSGGTPRGKGTDGEWMLVPREIDLMYLGEESFREVRKSEGLEIKNEDLLNGNIRIEGDKTVSILLDQGYLTKSFPKLTVSGGKNAEVKIAYAEALFNKDGTKGNRDVIEGKFFSGYYDVFIPDGGKNRTFSPLWFRTYRYVLVEIKTAEEPLEIHEIISQPTGFPLRERSSFKSDDPSLEKIWDIGFRTASLCAGEIYYDCPYYEQMQYVGDTRIQALISLYVDGNDKLMRKAIKHFDDSRRPNGLTQSRYPSSSQQIIPPYSLFWIAMIHDYWMYREDPKFVQSFIPGIKNVLEWFNERIDEHDLLGPLEWWNFVDWADEWPWNNAIRMGGVPFGVTEGHSSNITLQYAYALDLAVDLLNNFGNTVLAESYSETSVRIKNAVYENCWDEDKGLLADVPGKKIFSQHANIFGIITDAIPVQSQPKVMQKILEDDSLIQCTMYFRFYLFQAMKKTELADLYLDYLDQWHVMIENGLTTFAEKPDPTRSDCHAWSASPNYDLLATVCGIRPQTPGFKTVYIQPYLGKLENIEGRLFIPSFNDYIEINMKRTGESGISGIVKLPEGMTGSFKWKEETIQLISGKQNISLQ
jgi:hypothetical protein